IRDFHVTGVQTCALPIYWVEVYRSFGQPVAALADFLDVDGIIVSSDDPGLTDQRFQVLQSAIEKNIRPVQGRKIIVTRSQIGPEIGRASCRERGEVGGGA